MTRYPLIMAPFALMMLFVSMPALAQDCAPGVSVATDKGVYLQGDQVVISGQILDMDCSPVTSQNGIGIEILNPSGTHYYNNQLGTNDLGEFSTSFKLSDGAVLGEWTLLAAYSGNSDSETFMVSGGECLDGDTRQCGSTDVGACSFGTETCANGEWGACEGAVGPASEACGNGVDDDCDGSADEDCSSSSSSSSSSNSHSSSTCLPKYECSDWSACQPDDTQTRECDRVVGCGTSSTPPAESQSCDYSAGSESSGCVESWSCSDWSSCEDGSQSRECSDENSCGTTEDKPLETQPCEVQQSGTGDGVTGLAIGDIVSSYGLFILVMIIIIGAGAWKIMK